MFLQLIQHRQLATALLVLGMDDVLQEGTAFFPGSSLAGNGLLVSDGPLWRRQRQLSNPAFRRAAIDSYAQVCTLPVLASLSKKL